MAEGSILASLLQIPSVVKHRKAGRQSLVSLASFSPETGNLLEIRKPRHPT